MGHISVLYGQKRLYGAHVGLEWDKCQDSAHMGLTYTCLLGNISSHICGYDNILSKFNFQGPGLKFRGDMTEIFSIM